MSGRGLCLHLGLRCPGGSQTHTLPRKQAPAGLSPPALAQVAQGPCRHTHRDPHQPPQHWGRSPSDLQEEEEEEQASEAGTAGRAPQRSGGGRSLQTRRAGLIRGSGLLEGRGGGTGALELTCVHTEGTRGDALSAAAAVWGQTLRTSRQQTQLVFLSPPAPPRPMEGGSSPPGPWSPGKTKTGARPPAPVLPAPQALPSLGAEAAAAPCIQPPRPSTTRTEVQPPCRQAHSRSTICL